MKNFYKIVVLLMVVVIIAFGVKIYYSKNINIDVVQSVRDEKTQSTNEKTSSNQAEVTVMAYSGGDFSNNNIWSVTDISGKSWTIYYKNAQYYKSSIINGQEKISLGNAADFNSWLNTEKQATAPGYSGPGVPGLIKIIGTMSSDNILMASMIIQHVQ